MTLEDKINALVKDATKVGSIPKSEFRKRIFEIIHWQPTNNFNFDPEKDKDWIPGHPVDICGKCKSELREKIKNKFQIGHTYNLSVDEILSIIDE